MHWKIHSMQGHLASFWFHGYLIIPVFTLKFFLQSKVEHSWEDRHIYTDMFIYQIFSMDEKITTKIQTLGLSTENGHGKKCCTYSVLRNIVNISSFFYSQKRETFTSSGTICNHAKEKNKQPWQCIIPGSHGTTRQSHGGAGQGRGTLTSRVPVPYTCCSN